ncbi:hypothetical protein D1007_16282 [Hordeum vulgare]|nr:hypothetical protein D1007_16282 [Hordeum vulgare]
MDDKVLASSTDTGNPLKEPRDWAFVIKVDNRVAGHEQRFWAYLGGMAPALASAHVDFLISRSLFCLWHADCAVYHVDARLSLASLHIAGHYGLVLHESVRGGGAVRGAHGQVEKEPPDSASNIGDAAETFKFAINFFPSTTKLVDGCIQNIQRDTIVKWEVDCAEIDPNELQSMEEKAVRKLMEKIGETVLWGPEQEVSLLRYDDFKVEYVRIEDGEDIVDEIDRQEGWASLRAEFFAELVDLNIDSKVDAEEGNVAVVDWNAVELEEPTDLVIAPIAEAEMAKLFGIPVDDRMRRRGMKLIQVIMMTEN